MGGTDFNRRRSKNGAVVVEKLATLQARSAALERLLMAKAVCEDC